VENWRIAKLHEANQIIHGQENVTLAISSDEAGVLNYSSFTCLFDSYYAFGRLDLH